ncbi:ABC transporter ATP-binding protein [Candidatus Peribacteria bacterium]|nr:ABC transporter ATP-binding protein [Candidatus Peribacteria bacterium]
MHSPSITRRLLNTITSLRLLQLSPGQWRQLRLLWQRSRRPLRQIGLLLTLCSAAELALPLYVHHTIRAEFTALQQHAVVVSLLIVAGILLLYLMARWRYIRTTERFLTQRLHRLRLTQLQHHLQRTPPPSARDTGQLLSLLTYHFGLLSMGLRQTLLHGAEWLLLWTMYMISSATMHSSLLWLGMGVLLASVGLGLGGYAYVRRVVSREQTFYSKLLVEATVLSKEQSHYRQTATLGPALRHYQQLMETDTTLRTARELGMQFPQYVLFALLTLLAALGYWVQFYVPLGLEHLNGGLLSYGLLMGVAVQLLFLALRVGLYAFPLQLGLVLCLPESGAPLPRHRFPQLHAPGITLRTRHLRLADGTVQPHYSHAFPVGELTHLSTAETPVVLQALMGELTPSQQRVWMVILQTAQRRYRLQGNAYARASITRQYISPHTITSLPLIHYLSQAGGDPLTVLPRLSQYLQAPLFAFLQHHDLRQPLPPSALTQQQWGTLQYLRALLWPPQLLILHEEYAWLQPFLLAEKDQAFAHTVMVMANHTASPTL